MDLLNVALSAINTALIVASLVLYCVDRNR